MEKSTFNNNVSNIKGFTAFFFLDSLKHKVLNVE